MFGGTWDRLPPVRGGNLLGIGHTRDHLLQVAEGLATAGVVVPATQKDPEG